MTKCGNKTTVSRVAHRELEQNLASLIDCILVEGNTQMQLGRADSSRRRRVREQEQVEGERERCQREQPNALLAASECG